MTYYNEDGRAPEFPEWINPSSHNCIYGCMACQTVCPKNREFIRKITEPVEFTATETLWLIEGKPFEQFPETLKQKVKELGMIEYLGTLPRNLPVLLNREV